MITRASIHELISQALRSRDQPDYLHCSINSLVDQGVSRDWLYGELIHFKENELGTRGRERVEQEDIIDEVLEALVGWSSPHRRI
jgi:hypothetical protein